MSSQQLAEHFFRHEYGKLVAVLTHRVGSQWIGDVEDAVQQALLKGLESWSRTEIPDNPSAWLYRVAYNGLMDELRKRPLHQKLLQQHADSLPDLPDDDPTYISDSDIRDDQLRMMFACCEESIPSESQLVLSLKILCGFDVREISQRLFTSEANIYKRLTRARNRLKEQSFAPDGLNRAQYQSRLPSVHHILYLLFSEGHLSYRAAHSIRKELCEEAIRLCTLLTQHPIGQTSETWALLALMYLHMARLSSRETDSRELILLENQDRSQWNRRQIAMGLRYLGQSAEGEHLSRFHLEAAIAAEHCLAPSFKETRWENIAKSYQQLELIAPSPTHTLNRAIALAEWQAPNAGLELLANIEPPNWLFNNYQWPAVLADLNFRAGNTEEAIKLREVAIGLAPTEAVRDALSKRFQSLGT